MSSRKTLTLLIVFAFVFLSSASYGLTIYGLTFQKNSSEIPQEAYPKLDELTSVISEFIDNNEIPAIEINGYTDITGSPEHNVLLSKARAVSVMNYILEKYKDTGLTESNFTVRGFGASDFIAGNDTEQGRSANRRIELKITGKTAEKKMVMSEAVAAPEPANIINKESKPADTQTCWKCIGLIALDIGLAGYTVFAVYDQWAAADDYDKSYAELNDSEGTNFDILNAKKKIVDDKKTAVVIGAGLTAAALIYTAADYFWLHNVFPENVQIGLSPINNGIILTAGRDF